MDELLNGPTGNWPWPLNHQTVPGRDAKRPQIVAKGRSGEEPIIHVCGKGPVVS